MLKIGTVFEDKNEKWGILKKQEASWISKKIIKFGGLTGLEFGKDLKIIDLNSNLREVGLLSEREILFGLRELTIDWATEHQSEKQRQESEVGFIAGKTKLPPSGKVIREKEIQNMVHASLDGWLTAGRFSQKFERDLAMKLGASRAIAVNSGSSANLIALTTLTSPKLGDRALRAGDEVITAAAGFPTTINPILQNQLVPVLVDSNLNDGNINVDQIEAAIGPKTRAIMAAHTLGNPMDMDRIMRLAKKYNLWVIEDCCDALMSTINNRLCGSWGHLSTLSFYPAHHMTMGEGGAVFSQDLELMKIAESFRDWGRDCYCDPGRDNTCGKRFCQQFGELPEGYDHKYVYSHLGYNLKITDMQAACGLAQLESLDEFVLLRRKNYELLYSSLIKEGVDRYVDFQRPISGANPSWFGFMMTLKSSAKINRNDFVAYLEARGVATRLLFAGNVTKQPYFKNQKARVPFELRVADHFMENSLWVGIWPGLTEVQIQYMAKVIVDFFNV